MKKDGSSFYFGVNHRADNIAETPSAMAFVLEAMRVSNTFLLNLPPDADGTLDSLASVCGMDVASLKKYHSSLHSSKLTAGSRIPSSADNPCVLITHTSFAKPKIKHFPNSWDLRKQRTSNA